MSNTCLLNGCNKQARRKFCSNKHKDKWHNRNNPRGMYAPSISEERYQRYKDEFGGEPYFDENGEYAGFTGCALSIDDHDPNKE